MCNRIYTEDEKKIIQHVKNIQPHICFYCKKPLKAKEITMDHVVPLARGGQTVESNLVIACAECNKEKSDMTLEEYMKFLEVKYKAKNSIPLENEQKKLADMQKELENLNKDLRVAKCQYEGLLEAISIYPVENENACFRLQKLQLLMWEYKGNELKLKRLTETVKMQQDIVNYMEQQREKVVSNAIEDYKWMLGKLKVNTVQDLLRNRLNLKNGCNNNNNNIIVTNIIGNNNNVIINL